MPWPLKSSSVVSCRHSTTGCSAMRWALACQCGLRMSCQSMSSCAKKREAPRVSPQPPQAAGMLGVGCRLKVSASFTCRRFRRLSPRSRSANSSCAQLIRSIFSSKNQQLTAESSRCVQSDALEGLCVSYFVRTTKMYDTLMQMGRWFGYRPGYLDLCRLYISPDLMEWFGHIADASEELREEFDFMAEAELTPKQYGLKVMSHEVLTVTSPLKMRSSRPLSLTYSGTRSQTILFHRDAQRQKRNLDAAQTLVASLGASWAGILKYARDGNADSW